MRIACSIAMLLVATAAGPLCAAIVLLKGDAPAVKGIILRQNDAEVVVAVPLPGGGSEERVIPRAMIDDILLSVSPERLAALDPKQPKEYRNYAEELAEKRQDPEARGEALRLFLIAAYLDGKNLGRSSLLGMIALARSPAEEKKLRAMAYLLDPEHDASVLKAGGEPIAAPGAAPAAVPDDEAGLEIALGALRLYRQGKAREAAARIKQPGGAEQLARLRAPFTLEEFVAACTARAPTLNDPLFAQVLAVETRAAGGGSGGIRATPEPQAAGQWSRAAARGVPGPAPSLTLETLLEFDPRANVFRGGKWVRGG